jgi:hypothetical protein
MMNLIGLFRVRRCQLIVLSLIACGRRVKRSPYDHAFEEALASAFPSRSGRFGLCVYVVGADIEASVLGRHPSTRWPFSATIADDASGR